MSRYRYGSLLICLAILAGLAAPGWADEKPATAKAEAKAPNPPKETKLAITVKAVSGRAHRMVVTGEKTKWVPLAAGEKLDEMTVIRTGFRSKVVLRFADNSVVEIKRATKMGIAEFRKTGKVVKTRLGLKYGAVRTTVQKARAINDFTVATPVATMAITGSNPTQAFTGDFGYKAHMPQGHAIVTVGGKNLALGNRSGTDNSLTKWSALATQGVKPVLVGGGGSMALSGNELAFMKSFGGGLGGMTGVPGRGPGRNTANRGQPPILRRLDPSELKHAPTLTEKPTQRIILPPTGPTGPGGPVKPADPPPGCPGE